MRADILFTHDQEQELDIRAGDFVVGVSDIQHCRHIIEAEQGQYKQHPLVGVGVRKMLLSAMDQNQKRIIQLQLKSDGYTPQTLVVGEGIKIEL